MKPRIFPLVRIFWVLALVAAGVFAFLHWRSTHLLTATSEKVAAAEQRSRARGAAILRELQTGGQKGRLITAAISAKAVNELLALLDGVTYTDEKSGLFIRIQHAATRFSGGFPRISLEAELGHPMLGSDKMGVKAALVLVLDTASTASGDKVTLRPVFVDFEPGSKVPAALKTLINAEAVSRINDALPPLPLPVPKEFKIEATSADIAKMNQVLSKIRAPLPNGTAVISAKPPALPSVVLSIHPVLLIGSAEVLHVIAIANGSTPQEPQDPPAVTEDDLQKMLVGLSLAKDEDVALAVPSGPVDDALGEFNRRPAEQRSVTFTVTGEGHIKDTSGGAPFGNGYQSWFEGTPSGKAELSNLNFTWGNNQLDAALKINVSGKAQVHVHGNAPKPFGIKIGGGAGTSVGVPFNTRGNVELKGKITVQDNQLQASLLPGKIPARATITGIVDIPVDVDAPLPSDLKVNYVLPALVSPTPLALPPMEHLVIPVKKLTVEAHDPRIQIRAEGLRASASMSIRK